MKILVIKLRNIGDVLLMSALIKNLKLHYPNAEIDVVVNENTISMIKYNKHINKIYSYNRNLIKNKNFLSKLIFQIKFLKQFFRKKYDYVFNLTEGDRGVIISLLVNSENKFGYLPKNNLLKKINPFKKYKTTFEHIHAVERDLSFLSFCNKKPIKKKLELIFSKNEIDKILQFNLKNFVVVHPVARWKYKYWEYDRFAKVIDYIKSKGYEVVITGGNDSYEQEYIEKIISKTKTKPVDLSGKLTLCEVAALYSKAKFLVSVDSAPIHMGAALDIPVVALFGYSDPVVWGPWENELERGCYHDIRTLQKCGKHTIIQYDSDKILYIDGVKKSEAMLKITVEDVKNEIERYL